MRPRTLRASKTIKLGPLSFVEVPPSQAVRNLLDSCFGTPGIPVGFLKLAASSSALLEVVRDFGGARFPSLTLGGASVRLGARIRAHPTPSCTEFLVRSSSRVFSRAAGWGSPAVVLCQLPTPSLYTVYQPVYRVLERKVGRYDPGAVVLPSSRLVEEAYVRGREYPITLSLCSDGQLDTCASEALVLVVDEYVSTVLYAYNSESAAPGRRRVSLPGVPEVVVGGGELPSGGAEEDRGGG